MYEHQQLEDLEKKMYGKPNDLLTIIYKTSMIRLKPEYEIYNILLGQPEKKYNQIYNEIIINDIANLLLLDNMNFKKIKEYINNKYINN